MLEDSLSDSVKEAEAGFCGKDSDLNPGWEREYDKTSSFLVSPSSLSTKDFFSIAPHCPITRRQTELKAVDTCHLPEQALSWACLLYPTSATGCQLSARGVSQAHELLPVSLTPPCKMRGGRGKEGGSAPLKRRTYGYKTTSDQTHGSLPGSRLLY